MDYFENSQKIRRDLEEDSILLDETQKALNGELSPFGFGINYEVFRVGRLPSGLYIALRSFEENNFMRMEDFDDQINDLEDYCLNAEQLSSQGKKVPSFCVGVVCGNLAGILTEDLTVGGVEKIYQPSSEDYAFFGKDKRKVWIDIDSIFKSHPRNKILKYFAKENRIDI